MIVSIPASFRLPLAGVALAGLGLNLAALPARAQDPTYDGGAYQRTYDTRYDRGYDRASYDRDSSDEIIIRARPRGRSSTTGAPIERVTTSRVVDYRDLDVDSPWGARELHQRIHRAAYDACEQLDDQYPIGEPDVDGCVSEAVRNAEHDVPRHDDYRDRW